MLVRPDPLWKRSVQELLMVISSLRNKLNGDEGSEPFRDHFNQVMRDIKIFCKDPKPACGFDPETYALASRMAGNEDLERIIMNINTIDDVDEDIANRILQILEPDYARPAPTKFLYGDPIWKESVQKLIVVILAVLNKLNGDEGCEAIRDHFNRAVREAKSVCTDPNNAEGFERESYELAMRMADNEVLEKIIMNIDSIDDVDEDMAYQILQQLEPAYVGSRPTKKIFA